ncbi:hypothetical protein BH10PLA1_BH10PLA1_22140 [soil metagenome]
MAVATKSGKTLQVTITKTINRDGARKTLERLFMQDKAIHRPIEIRSANFKELPKRRGGQIWTKRPNKVHPILIPGVAATIKSTPQTLRDLASVNTFVTVK